MISPGIPVGITPVTPAGIHAAVPDEISPAFSPRNPPKISLRFRKELNQFFFVKFPSVILLQTPARIAPGFSVGRIPPEFFF